MESWKVADADVALWDMWWDCCEMWELDEKVADAGCCVVGYVVGLRCFPSDKKKNLPLFLIFSIYL